MNKNARIHVFYLRKKNVSFSKNVVDIYEASLKYGTQASNSIQYFPGSNIPQNSSCTATYWPIFKTIQTRRTKYVGYCWRRKDKLQRSHYESLQVLDDQLELIYNSCTDTRCCLEDLLEAIDDTDEWQERVRKICARNTTSDDDDLSFV